METGDTTELIRGGAAIVYTPYQLQHLLVGMDRGERLTLVSGGGGRGF